jgi:hypothetical protein
MENNMLRLQSALLGATLLMAIGAGAAIAASGEAADNASIHAGASFSSPVVGSLTAGEHVSIGNCNDKWCYVRHGRKMGFVLVDQLSEYESGSANAGAPPTTIIIGPGHGHPHHPHPPVVVDPGPKHPIHPIGVGPILGTLPVANPGEPPHKPPPVHKPPFGTVLGTGGIVGGNNAGVGGGGGTVGGGGGSPPVCSVKPYLPQCGGGGGSGSNKPKPK